MSKSKQQNVVQQKYLVTPSELDISNTLGEMLAKRQNKYLLVNLISRRSRELNRGDRPYTQLPRPYSNTQLATAEVVQGKLSLQRKAASKVLVNLIATE
jgi:DNA-directed RNA polymerase subunit K/omega